MGCGDTHVAENAACDEMFKYAPVLTVFLLPHGQRATSHDPGVLLPGIKTSGPRPGTLFSHLWAFAWIPCLCQMV